MKGTSALPAPTQSGPTRDVWRPLFRGAEAEPVLDALRRIAESVRPSSEDAVANPSLVKGEAGVALLYAYLARAGGGARCAEAARQCLETAISSLTKRPSGPFLYGGATGIAWVVEHLSSQLQELPEDLNDLIDEELRKRLRRTPWRGHFDLVSGLVGFGLYALERLPRPAAVDCVQSVLNRLRELAKPQPSGLAWWSDARFLGPDRSSRFPRGCFDLGMAHGVSGVIAFLAGVVASGICPSGARELAEGAMSWVLAQAYLGEDRSRFTNAFEPGRPSSGSRYAWCYGDPAVASALFLTSRALGNRGEWELAAIELARLAARRPPEQSGVMDAGLCHGAAGLAHLYNRLAQAAGDDVLLAASRFWVRRALDLLGEETLKDRSFIQGVTGVGLALLATVSDTEPAWDRILLLSTPAAY